MLILAVISMRHPPGLSLVPFNSLERRDEEFQSIDYSQNLELLFLRNVAPFFKPHPSGSDLVQPSIDC